MSQPGSHAATEIVADHDLFTDLSDDQRALIERRMLVVDVPAGHLFYAPDDSDDRIYLLRRGRVRIYKLSLEGRALTLLTLAAPAIFGEMALNEQWQHDSFAEAVTQCQIGLFRRDAMRALLAELPALTLRLMSVMTTRLRAMERRLADIAFKSVSQRLAAVLLELAQPPAAPAELPCVSRYTHQQLAELIGSYRETVTKTIGDFRGDGLIRIEDDTIVLLDRPRLQALAGMA